MQDILNLYIRRSLLLVTIILFLGSCRSLRILEAGSFGISDYNRVGLLDPELRETSGLQIDHDSLLTFNDSGGKASLYIFSPLTPLKAREIPLPGSRNTDWEDIAGDSLYIYIGDFGNNKDQRDTLYIYRYNKEHLKKEPGNPEIISYVLNEENQVYDEKSGESFNCEAMVVIKDSLWLFTKSRAGRISRIYRLPASPGFHKPEAIRVLKTNMQVTGADYIPGQKLLFLIGYKNFVPRIRSYKLSGSSLRELFILRMGNLVGVQTEGISVKDGLLYFTNEKSLRKPSLYRIYYNTIPDRSRDPWQNFH